ncbi:MAG TPA: hypothetical protein VM598_06530 [Bdellovibrionota bacterium]|nr:hypothetical protein [Bdellovibrionota bacterium]
MEFRFAPSRLIAGIFLLWSAIAQAADPPAVSPAVARLLAENRRIRPEESAAVSVDELDRAYRALGGTAITGGFRQMDHLGQDILSRVDRSLAGFPGNMSEVRVYVVGASMESFYNYASLMGSQTLRPDQFRHLPISRALRQNDMGALQAYLFRRMSEDVRAGRKVILLDTIATGETFANLRVELGRVWSAAGRADGPIFMGLPEGPGTYGGATPVSSVAAALGAPERGAPPKVVDLGLIKNIFQRMGISPRTMLTAHRFVDDEPTWTVPDKPGFAERIGRERVRGMRYQRHVMARAVWLGGCSPGEAVGLLMSGISTRP